MNWGKADRDYSIKMLQRIVDPVLIPLSEDKLNMVIPRRSWETRNSNIHTSPLQAFGRSLSGLAPWLSLGEDKSIEGNLRKKYIDLAVKCIRIATDPKSKDFMFKKHTQERIVHATYLAYPLLIASDELWEPLTEKEKANVIAALKTHRKFKPNESNWLLFSSVLECAIWKFTGECEIEPIEYAVEKHLEWYVGDGTYGDGQNFHWDWYNSYVIQPLLLETLRVCKEKEHPLAQYLPVVLARAKRYAEVQEHMISPEGTFPVIGRSSVYRIAFLQHIGYMAFRWELPVSIDNGATRSAMTAVVNNMMEASGTFDENGWLNAGVVGYQPEARDYYNYTGALYMCAMGLSHLGASVDSKFWSEPSGKWFQQRVWDGEKIMSQKAHK